jgi:hypothetical protein
MILLFEMALLIVAFDIDFFYNFWWALELLVVLISVGVEFFGSLLYAEQLAGAEEIALVVLLGWRVVRVVHSATDMVEKSYVRTQKFMKDSRQVGREDALAMLRNRALVNAIETTAQRLRLGWALGDSAAASTVQIDVQSINLAVLERAPLNAGAVGGAEGTLATRGRFHAIIALQVMRPDPVAPGEYSPVGDVQYTSYPVVTSLNTARHPEGLDPLRDGQRSVLSSVVCFCLLLLIVFCLLVFSSFILSATPRTAAMAAMVAMAADTGSTANHRAQRPTCTSTTESAQRQRSTRHATPRRRERRTPCF